MDTDVFIAAVLSPSGSSASILELCFQKQYCPLMGTALYLEYEDAINRSELFKRCLIKKCVRFQSFDGFLSICMWTRVYYSWHPNLKDEGNNHLIELAVADGTNIIVTLDIMDFNKPELFFPDIAILQPDQFFKEI